MRWLIHIILFLHGITLCAQTSKIRKTDTLSLITIQAHRKDIWAESKQRLDSSVLNRHTGFSINQILQLHSNVFVKNYGVSGLSTLSIRGSSAAQTSVFWNGININNALTGITDLSTLPVSFFDKMDISYGSNESNAVSGGIDLINTTPEFRNTIKASISGYADNIGKAYLGGSIHLGQGRLQNKLKIALIQDNNSFSFFNPDTRLQDTLLHAKQRQQALLNDLHILVGPKHVFSWHSWVQLNQREIPAATFEPDSRKSENIQNIRNIVQFTGKVNSQFSIKTSLGVLYEHYNYTDSAISLFSDASLINLPFNASFIFTPNYNHSIQADVLFSNNRMIAPQQNNLVKGGLRLLYSIQRVRRIPLALKTSVLYERTNVFQTPPAFEFSTIYSIRRDLDLIGSISTRYRMPTLNELYYKPGGNENLKPETSKNAELGFKVKKNYKRISFNGHFTSYRRLVDNWIVWYGNSILTPRNIQQVNSRGFETEAHLNYRLSKPSPSDEVYIVDERPISQIPRLLYTNLYYSYTLSTTAESAIPNDYSIGRQLPYVPRYQLKVSSGFTNKNFDVQGIYTYTGYRFVTTDESQWLTPYHYFGLHLSYTFYSKTSPFKYEFQVKLNNISDSQYQGIVGRMMPGRNVGLGIVARYR